MRETLKKQDQIQIFLLNYGHKQRYSIRSHVHIIIISNVLKCLMNKK